MGDLKFLDECELVRKKFQKIIAPVLQLRRQLKSEEEIERIATEKINKRNHIDINAVITKLAKAHDTNSRKHLDIHVKMVIAEIAKTIEAEGLEYFLASRKLLETPDFQNAIFEITEKYTKKYKLSPMRQWFFTIAEFIAFKETNPPAIMDFPIETLPDFVMDEKEERRFANLNFGIKVVNDEITGEPEFFIQIFKDTSKDDVVKGWNTINLIRKNTVGENRFYPVKNLKRYQKIAKADKELGKASDWEKQRVVFGEATSENWGAIETKRKKSLKQGRYYIKRKFGTKS